MKKNNKKVYEDSVELHKKLQGKMSTELKAPIDTYEDLSLLYSPGVARPCELIKDDKDKVYDFTSKSNTIAIVSDGSAVLGLGNIGPEAALPVMEGKAALFKRFGNVNAVPIVLDTQDPDEIIQICKAIAPGFGGINLEDISSPNCVYIEKELEKELDIPVFHDDQHGTSIVTIAALINALKLVNKKPKDVKMVVSGAGAAGSAIISLAVELGIKNIYAFNSKGIITKQQETKDPVLRQVQSLTNNDNKTGDLSETLKNADIFIGVSIANILNQEMVKTMAKDAIVLAMANPNPEINYDDAKKAGARVVGTGRSDYPNQINNILVFPGLFKGLLEVRATSVPNEVKLASAYAIASAVKDEITDINVVPEVFNENLNTILVNKVKDTVIKLRKEGRNV